jgi:hypothetical protein
VAVKSSINRKKQLYLLSWPIILNQHQHPPRIRIIDKLLDLIEKDLEEGFTNANAVASDSKDRGALRALGLE